MSDPLSLTGTAVGIVSLGITICQGLFVYLQSIRGRRQEIKDGITEVEALLNVFTSLNDALPNFQKQDRETAAVLLLCLQKNESTLLDLKKVLDDLNQSVSSFSDLKGKMKASGHALMYPFRQETLRSLQSAASRLLESLKLGLQLASLKSDTSALEKLDEIKIFQRTEAVNRENAFLALSTSLHENGERLQSLRTSMADFRSEMNMHLTEIKDGVSSMTTSLEGLHDTSNRLTEQMTEGMNSLHDISNRIIEQMTEGMSEMKLLMTQADRRGGDYSKQLHHHFVTKMAMLQSTQSQSMPYSRRLSSHLTHQSHPTSAPSTFDPDAEPANANLVTKYNSSGLCTCTVSHQRIRGARASIELSSLSMTWTHQNQGHGPQCPLYGIGNQAKKSFSARMKMGILNHYIRMVEVGLSYTAGRGGFHLAPVIRLRNIVPESQSPVFDVMRRLRNSCNSHLTEPINNIVAEFKKAELEIVQLYRDGLASPMDLTEDGFTHVAEAISLMSIFMQQPHSIIVKGVVEIIDTLTRCGSEFIVDNRSYCFLNCVFWSVPSWPSTLRFQPYQVYDAIISRVMRGTDPTLEDLVSVCTGVNLPYVFSTLPDVLDGMDVPPIIRAILSKSMSQLDHEIARCPNEVLKITHGLTTLRWSIGWPQGLRRLLETDFARILLVNAESQFVPPLLAAVKIDCAESLDVLLEAGCEMYDAENGFAFEGMEGRCSADCSQVIAAHLADRRRQLLQLAQTNLPSELLDSNTFAPEFIPDESASQLCVMLQQFGFPIPRNLRVPETIRSVYHFDIPISHFPIFYNVGFRGYNAPNSIGLRPVMIWRYKRFGFYGFDDPELPTTFRALQWFIDLGCLDQSPEDPKNVGINISATGWHFLSSLLGTYFCFNNHSKTTVQYLPVVQSFLQKLLRKKTDDCTCWCNLGGNGCSPLKSLYKSRCSPLRYEKERVSYAWGDRDMYDPGNTTRWIRHAIFHHPISEQAPDQETGMPSTRCLELVRFLTFEALDMTHTCCAVRCINHDSDDPECGRRICDELTALINCQPDIVESIREQENHLEQQLEALMSEFVDVMAAMPFSRRGLERFVWGYWRRRMSGFYTVDPEVVEAMAEKVGRVTTYVTPEPLQRLLGEEFTFEMEPPEDRHNLDVDDEESVDGCHADCFWCEQFDEFDAFRESDNLEAWLNR